MLEIEALKKQMNITEKDLKIDFDQIYNLQKAYFDIAVILFKIVINKQKIIEIKNFRGDEECTSSQMTPGEIFD